MKKLLISTLALAATAAFAYPDKPVTMVVPFAAGGPTDKVARDLAVAMGAVLKQTIIVENVGGAGGTLGATKVAKASPDGYTVLLHHIGMATSPGLYRNLPFKTLDDFEYLGMVNDVPMTLIGRPTLPANNYAELVKWLEANKGKVNLANAGLGAASHLCGLLFQQSIKIDMTTVPYKGTGPAMTDLLGGQVEHRVFGGIGLDDGPAGVLAPPRPAHHLCEQIEGALVAAKVVAEQSLVRREHTHQGDVFKVQALGHHLGPH